MESNKKIPSVKKRYLYISLIIALLLGLSACEGLDQDDNEGEESIVVEQSDEVKEVPDGVSVEFDENGNPTGEYAKYLWEQQQMEEAKNSMAEEAIRSQLEEDYETHAFPLD